jgi:hypothetical protein
VGRDGVESSAIDKYRWRKSKMKSFYKGVISESDNVLPIDSSLLRGDGVFETILSIDQVAIAWDRHFARLEKAKDNFEKHVDKKDSGNYELLLFDYCYFLSYSLHREPYLSIA